jgi:hypothetical protein
MGEFVGSADADAAMASAATTDVAVTANMGFIPFTSPDAAERLHLD